MVCGCVCTCECMNACAHVCVCMGVCVCVETTFNETSLTDFNTFHSGGQVRLYRNVRTLSVQRSLLPPDIS